MARLKIFCAALNLPFKETNERIIEAQKAFAAQGFLSLAEIQERFMVVSRSGLTDINLGEKFFWELVNLKGFSRG